MPALFPLSYSTPITFIDGICRVETTLSIELPKKTQSVPLHHVYICRRWVNASSCECRGKCSSPLRTQNNAYLRNAKSCLSLICRGSWTLERHALSILSNRDCPFPDSELSAWYACGALTKYLAASVKSLRGRMKLACKLMRKFRLLCPSTIIENWHIAPSTQRMFTRNSYSVFY